jgi:hypothetical protein
MGSDGLWDELTKSEVSKVYIISILDCPKKLK